ncbi:MAG: hypothetical protein WCA04_05530 [Geobacteraceae bacterium]
MQSTIVIFSVCLLLALAVPSWGDCTKSSPAKSPQQVTAPSAPIVLPGGYVRNPAEIKARQQYFKNLRLKAKEAAANRAAAKAKQAGQQTTTPPQQTQGGSQ